MKRTLLAVLCASALLGAAACGGDEKAAPGNQVDRILAATAEIVSQCRAVENGLLSSPSMEVIERDVDILLAAAEEFDLDAPFPQPQPAIEPETTLREQIELASGLLGGLCSPEHAAELRAAIED
jgi:arginine/lysine/ornithine decarboxylase